MNQKDILLNDAGDLLILSGDFVVGESELQEIEHILVLMQGGLKSDPILGPNLLFYEKSNQTKEAIKSKVVLALKRDGKNYSEIQKKLEFKAKQK